ncbi:YihY/virulence factor BrkB family protein [Saccharopolyspora erythraea]|uniref:YihY/virulence factor BrkB family protein n=1 Tax=Saccharopolyspora erythraea TaxID=1836 RepID=UPI001BA9ECB1|nr:YihY/virulence factor BrkB family protein [Saccharopolyspora erythraea]QUH01311.1 YihY/virulence factor BrkB family protein [Saccharopolyspora erythraea]
MAASPNNHYRPQTPPDRPVKRGPLRLVWRTVTKAWWDNIFSESAAAAFWQTLSMPPLLLGLLGSIGFIADWFGPAVIDAVHANILGFSRTVFSSNVVDQIIAPTVGDILTKGRTEIVSVGFLLSLWAGSSALASLVDSITLAYNQYMVRHSVWQRTFALLLYLVSLVLAVIGLPVIALGPDWLVRVVPQEFQDDVAWLIRVFYYPATGVLLVLALATLYKVSLPRKLPWHRGLPGALLAMLVFLCSSIGMRLYIAWVTGTGYTYGALATPIAFLLFAFFIGMAIIIGAQFNNAIEEMWPAKMTRKERRRWRRLEMRRMAQRMHTEEGYQAWRNGNAEHTGDEEPGVPPTLHLPRNGTAPATEGTEARESGRELAREDDSADPEHTEQARAADAEKVRRAEQRGG